MVTAMLPGSRAQRAGVSLDDVVLTVDGFPALAPADVGERLSGGEGALLEVLREGVVVTLRVEPAA